MSELDSDSRELAPEVRVLLLELLDLPFESLDRREGHAVGPMWRAPDASVL
jgi:hypothetical protein